MKNKVILWDFDGVIMNSNEVRDLGFLQVLKDFPNDQVNELLAFHQKNGGLSRYVKFRYFFETIRNEVVYESEIQSWADKFSIIMKQLLINPSLLIDETLQFIQNNYQKYEMHIVSGSDQNELKYLCRQLGIDHYFVSINGSPTPKKVIVADIIDLNNKDYLLIGDSINDYDAAIHNEINFSGFNNTDLMDKGNYITSFTGFKY